jgi:hypothetical protein
MGFFLSALHEGKPGRMRRWVSERWGWVLLCSVLLAALVHAQPIHTPDAHGQESHHHDAAHGSAAVTGWEGSAEGKAYSEFNHHLAGVFVILIGLSELRGALGIIPSFAWTRLLLPVFMLAVGTYLMIWSDHDAWPIGSLTFTETFFAGEWETVQHKLIGILLLLISGIEWLRRTASLHHLWWRIPLPVFAVISGLSLFVHTHGEHPAAHNIAFHHAIMGVMALTAGSSKLISARSQTDAAKDIDARGAAPRSRWERIWAILVLLIGVQLLIYAE